MSLTLTRSEFLQVFAAYNSAVLPHLIVAAFLGALAILLLLRRPRGCDRAISTIRFVFGSMMAVGYHGSFFAINDAAYQFGSLFLLAASAER